MGSTGVWHFSYNINNGRYCTNDVNNPTPPKFDNSNWITKQENKPIEFKLPTITPSIAFPTVEDEDESMPF